MDILDILLDDEVEAAKPSSKPETSAEQDVEGDIDLLLEEYSSGDADTKKASLRALISLIKR